MQLMNWTFLEQAEMTSQDLIFALETDIKVHFPLKTQQLMH